MPSKRAPNSKRVYQYPGQAVGEALAYWLNGPPNKDWKKWADLFQRRFRIAMHFTPRKDSKARQRVLELLKSLQEIERVYRLIGNTALKKLPSHELNLMRQAAASVNRILRRQVTYPQISLNDLAWEGDQLRWFRGPRPYEWATGSRSHFSPLQEHWAVTWAIRRLVDLGRLDRLRPCTECSRFFFAKRDNAVYCVDCRAKRYSTEHYKDWRANYERK